MILPGKLEKQSLGDVLGTLLRAGTSGVLELTESEGPQAGASHLIHLVSGRPAAVTTDGPRLGEILTAAVGLDPRTVEATLGSREDTDPRLAGELLVEAGATSEGPIELGLRAQTRGRLDRLFRVRAARLSFHAARLSTIVSPRLLRAIHTAPRLHASEFLHGRPRGRGRREAPKEVDDRALALRVLGLTKDATADDVRRAFRRIALDLHPDRAPDSTRVERTQAFARVVAAYQRLMDA